MELRSSYKEEREGNELRDGMPEEQVEAGIGDTDGFGAGEETEKEPLLLALPLLQLGDGDAMPMGTSPIDGDGEGVLDVRVELKQRVVVRFFKVVWGSASRASSAEDEKNAGAACKDG